MTRYLGVDYGTKRVGLAISDGLGITARPLEVVDPKRAVARIAEIHSEYDLQAIVVGLPTSLGGGEGKSAEAARNFGDQLASRLALEVVYIDERFTTNIAESALLESGVKRRRRRDTVDKVAAAIILQGYLDTRRRGGN
ncbi:MAG: Holliday junction resolvase RuvX [Acidimicrobiia bacterium]|nr:Holliday junction resolvase RuvX [Acidimicrobiia bacterium]